MKVKIDVIIEDQLTQITKGIRRPFEAISIEDDYFLDGPISNRVAVLDFDQEGVLQKSLKFFPATNNREANYGSFNDLDVQSTPFIQANVFGIVHRTLEMFEEEDNLGRRVQWAFNSPQLLVIPRAGEWANAFYQRDSCSLQFFHFPSKIKPGETIYTSLSHDIVAHETAHAILDGIAPDLYHALTPQSLALHEAIADLTALVMSFRSKPLRETVLKQTRGRIDNSTAFSSIAKEFGANLQSDNYLRPLRNLKNNNKLTPGHRTEPHLLSEVLTGALYEIMIKIYEKWLKIKMEETNQDRLSSSGFALFAAGEQFKRMVFRALDYLPPGDVSFADYGRAIIAADKTGHKQYEEERDWIAQEFVKRQIIADSAELSEPMISSNSKKKLNNALAKIDLQALLDSDWLAYNFVGSNQKTLGIPNDVAFHIHDRQKIKKTYYLNEGKKSIAECLLKVSWSQIEENPRGTGLPPQRVIPVGITLAIDWDTKQVLSYLKTDSSSQQKSDRDEMLLALQDKGLLGLTHEGFELDNIFTNSKIECSISNGIMRVKNTAQMLHISTDH